MSNVRKYAFDTEFTADGKIVREGAAGVKSRYTPEEVEAERKAAYEKGKQDATAQAERDAAAALKRLAEAAETTLSRLDHESRDMREEAARVAVAAARKIAGLALEGFGVESAQGAIEAAMDALRHQPRLLVKLPPAMAEQLRDRVEEMRLSHAYDGSILIRDDAKLAAGEVVIDWTDGAISLNPEDTAARIDALVEAALKGAHGQE